MRGVQYWDPDKNFWECNPFFKVPKVFNELYTKDKSKDKNNSSQIMWAIALYTDSGSMYKDLTDDERRKYISDEYNIDFKKYQELIDAWEVFKTPIEKQMEQWQRLMVQKNAMLKNLNLDINNWETIEEMVLSNAALYKAYEALKARLAQEEDSGTARGGQEESLSEKGLI